MARVFIDSSIVGEKWFSDVLGELLNNPRVRFAYGKHPKLLGEAERAKKLGRLYKIVGDMGRRDDAEEADCARHVAILEAVDKWEREPACDDPHVFAIIYEKPAPFVFSNDARLAACRDCINSVVDSRYCKFRLVRTKSNYDEKRHEIHA